MDSSNKLGRYLQDYKDLNVFFSGERAVKKAGSDYTPRLEGQKDNSQYNTYKDMGILFPALSRTRQGLKGAILRKDMVVDFEPSKEELLDNIMASGGSFDDLGRETTDEVLGNGRYGVLVDIDEKGDPYTASYSATSILEWSMSSRFGEQKIKLLEILTVDDPDKPGETKEIEQMRQLELEDGVYKVTIFRRPENDVGGDTWVQYNEAGKENPMYPKRTGGHTLDFIPFTFIGSSNNTPEPSKPPLLDLLNLSMGHWKLSVSYYYGLHFAGLPTPIFAGFSIEKDSKVSIGPGTAFHTDNPDAKAYYMQTEGKGLTEIVTGLDKIEKIMAVTGARMLESQRPGVEAAETVKLRSSGDSATLADIAGNIEAGLTDVLRDIGYFIFGTKNEKYKVTVNRDFVSTRLSSQDVTALLEALNSNAISLDSFINNLILGEILESGRTVDEEKEAIDEDRVKQAEETKKFNDLTGGFDE